MLLYSLVKQDSYYQIRENMTGFIFGYYTDEFSARRNTKELNKLFGR